MQNIFPFAGAIFLFTFAISAGGNESPYGVCAHLAGGEEHGQMPENLRLMNDAGIAWARADFSWNSVATADGKWRFEHLDNVLKHAGNAEVTILPILDYNVPWADPAFEHLDAWGEYVEKIVSRYKDRLKFYEVWNEQNIVNFWKNPNAADYEKLLERTYEVIKKNGTDLQVVYGGTAGVPRDFIAQSLELGAAKFFDVFNIHPYRIGMREMVHFQEFYDELRWVRGMLDKNDAAGKPLWITEQGWATPPGFSATFSQIIAATKEILAPQNAAWTIAFLLDERYVASANWSRAIIEKMTPPGFHAKIISLDELAKISPKECPALVLPPSEFSPTPYLENLQNYVKNGGALFLFGGVPFYYETVWKEGLLASTNHGNNAARDAFKIGWKAWWTEKNIPEMAPIAVAQNAKKFFKETTKLGENGRFLTAEKLQKEDEFIPLLEARKGDFTGVTAAIYKYATGGSTVVCTIMGDAVNATEEEQAIFLPQAILLALQAGVERYFWYEFHAPEFDDLDKEAHFGIVHKNLSPKPAFFAYKTLAHARPAGSKTLTNGTDWNKGDYCEIRWKRPDGTNGTALWTPKRDIKIAIKPNAKVFDYLGNTVKLDGEKITLGNGVIYVIEEN